MQGPLFCTCCTQLRYCMVIPFMFNQCNEVTAYTAIRPGSLAQERVLRVLSAKVCFVTQIRQEGTGRAAPAVMVQSLDHPSL